MDETKAKRQAALEEKKRRLQELKERRKRTQQKQKEERTSLDSTTKDDKSVLTTTTIDSHDSSQQQQNLNEYIETLLSSPKPIRKKNVGDQDAKIEAMANETMAIETPPPKINVEHDIKHDIKYDISQPKQKTVDTFEMGTQTDIEYDILPYMQQLEKDEPIVVSPKNPSPIKEQQPKELKPNDKNIQVSEESLNSFLQKASLKVERLLDTYTLSDMLLGSDYYSIPEDNQEKKDIGDANVSCKPITSLTHSILKNHTISDFQFSKFYKELVLVSYSNSDDFYNDSTTDGVVVLYNLHLSSDMNCRPEHVLHSTSGGVTSTTFHPTDPNILLGGCTNGDLLLWDVRVNTKLPVSTSKQQHSNNSIDWYSLSCIQSSRKDNDIIYAITNTGSIVVYSLHQLSKPIHILPISDFGLSCMTQVDDGILCGDTIGSLYSISASTLSNNSKNTIQQLSNQHYGTITDISSNKNNIIASSGIDWKTNIYHNDTTTLTYKENTHVTTTSTIKPMISICKDYEIISSISFHPTIPSLIVQSNYNGVVQCYDLSLKSNNYVEQQDPIVLIKKEGIVNKIRFSADGLMLGCCGDGANSLLDIYGFHVKDGSEFREDAMMEHFVTRGFIAKSFIDDDDMDIY